MKRSNIALLVLGSYLLFHFVLPEISIRMGIESNFAFAFLRFLSFVTIPIIMFDAIKFTNSIKYISISLFLVAVGFLLIESSGPNPGAIYSFFLGIFFIIIMFSSLYIFVVGLTLEPTHYFKRRVGVFLVFTSILLILKYSGILNIGYYVLIDYVKTSGAEWDVRFILTIVNEIVFSSYFLFQFLALDAIIVERNKYI